MATQLGQDYEVDYVDGVALRSPSITAQDIKRVIGRLNRLVRQGAATSAKAQEVSPGVQLLLAPLVPYGTSLELARRWNTHAIARRVSNWRDSDCPVLWTYTPETYGLERHASHVVYHCVDLLGEFPRISKGGIIRAEQRLASADNVTAIASSVVVQEHLCAQGFRDPILWENVADVGLFDSQTEQHRVESSLVFAGNLTDAKVDTDLLEDLIADRNLKVHIAGPVAEGGGASRRILRLLEEPNVEYHGELDLSDLSALLNKMEIGLIPYLDNPYTAGVFPLKLWEYLAAGLGVVMTDLPSVRRSRSIRGVSDQGDVRICGDSASFRQNVRALLDLPPDERASARTRRRRMAKDHSWSRRGIEARSLVAGLS
jgi:glycosyltransferase involved in cell wall biosynthesis